MPGGGVLVVNAGSSSIKAALIREGGERVKIAATEIGGAARLTLSGPGLAHEDHAVGLPDHKAATQAILDRISAAGIALSGLDGIGHRVVHGGPDLTDTTRITADTRARIEACAPLAPLHTPPALAAIDALTALAPGLTQYAVFDTAFHATIPDVARRYALPETADTKGLIRYGFHGISYAGLAERLPDIAGVPLPRRVLALHLGNGASLCAIKDGRSIATTMGYSPLAGLTMGTRAGTIDGDAVLALAARVGIERAGNILNRESGLKGLAGASDMRTLSADDRPAARFALRHFAYWAIRHAGSMVAAMGGCDAIAFTAGVGENDAAMRAEILNGLTYLGVSIDETANATHGPALHQARSRVTAWVVPAREEATIAKAVLSAMVAA